MTVIVNAHGEYQTVNDASRTTSYAAASVFDMQSPSQTVIRLLDGLGGIGRSATYLTVYRTNPWVHGAVTGIRRGMTRAPIEVLGPDNTEPAVKPSKKSRQARAAYALRRPSPGMSPTALWGGLVIDRLVLSNALLVVHQDRDGISGLERIPWRFVIPEQRAGVRTYTDARTKKRWISDDVVHFGYGEGDGLVAPSQLEALHNTLALWDAVSRHLLAFFANGARPTGTIEVAPGTGKPVLDEIRAGIKELHEGPDNAGRVLLSSGKFTPITAAPDHARVIELSEKSRDETLAVFGMPPPLVGVLAAANYSNVKEMRGHYLRDVVGPRAAEMHDDLEAQMFAMQPGLEDYRPRFNMDAALRPDIEARFEVYRNADGVLTPNEKRDLENLPRSTNKAADQLWMPLNYQPMAVTAHNLAPTEPAYTEDTDQEAA